MDRLESMSIFVSVVEAGSLSAASRKLRIPLASVSRKLSELESHLGILLLSRTTRRLELTEVGRTYLAQCTRILDEISEAERVATGEYSSPKGKLLITAPVVFGRLHVLPVVTSFLNAYPEVDVELQLTDRLVDMNEEHIDVAVRIGELADSSMIAIRLGLIREVICGSPTYFAERGIPRKPEDLTRHDCITVKSLASPTAWDFHRGKSIFSVPIRSRLIVSTVDAGIDAAIEGVGIIRLLSYQIEKLQQSGRLKSVLRDAEPEPVPVHLVHAGSRIVPLKLRAFLDYAAPRLKRK